jgi:Fe-S cluster assembly iron-binding protein IscA
MVNLTDIAAQKVHDFMNGQSAESEIGLRVGVRGGGCSGFQYALALDESFQGSGFEVSNPNVTASCGCGSSFRIADEEPSCGSSVA